MKNAFKSPGVALLIAVCCCLFPTAAQGVESTYAIDTQNTGLLDYGSYNLNFRLFNNGGVLTRLGFGVFKIVNLGVGWEINSAIGDQNITVSPPSLFLKIRPFAGDAILPAVVFGYDGQGYFYNRDTNEYLQKEKGIFLAVGREIFIPGLDFTLGANMADFRNNIVEGFTSLEYSIEDKFSVIAEYDNVHYLPDSRFNLGVRFSIAEDLSIDIAGRDIGAAGRNAERIVRINYTGKF